MGTKSEKCTFVWKNGGGIAGIITVSLIYLKMRVQKGEERHAKPLSFPVSESKFQVGGRRREIDILCDFSGILE